jgi:hypothetical protein
MNFYVLDALKSDRATEQKTRNTREKHNKRSEKTSVATRNAFLSADQRVGGGKFRSTIIPRQSQVMSVASSSPWQHHQLSV